MSLKQQKSSSRRTAAHLPDFSRAIALLTEQANKRDALIIKLIATTGITPSELVNLQVRDLRKQTLRIREENSKNSQRRDIALTAQVWRQLALHVATRKATDYVFSTRQSPQLTTRRVEQVFKDASQRAGVQVTPRDLRQAYLQQAAQTARSDDELKELTGLKSITRKTTLSSTQTKKLLESKLTRREHALVNLLLETAITTKEASRLHTRELKEQEIIVSGRHIPISSSLSSQLSTLAEQPDSHIFCTRQSPKLSPRRVEQIIAQAGTKAGLSISTRLLRATAIARIAEEFGVDEAQRRAGISTPLTYKYGILGGGAP